MLIDWTKPVSTRNGFAITVTAFFATRYGEEMVNGTITNKDGDKIRLGWNQNGAHLARELYAVNPQKEAPLGA